MDGPVEEAAKIASPQQMFKQEKHSPRHAHGNGYGDRRYAPRKSYGCGQEGHYKKDCPRLPVRRLNKGAGDNGWFIEGIVQGRKARFLLDSGAQ